MSIYFKPSTLLILALILFTIINPSTSGDIIAFLAVALILAHKISGDYAVLVLLAIRPALDWWRDFSFLQLEGFSININAGLSLLLFAWSVYFFVKHRADWKNIPAKIPWLLFIGWSAMSFLYSFDRAATLTETLKAANLFALFGVVYILRCRDGQRFAKKFYATLALAAAIPLLLAVYQFITKTGLAIDNVPNRIYGTFAHPNILATFALLLFMVLTKKVIEKNILLPSGHHDKNTPPQLKLALIFLGIIIALTYTRIAWIGLGIFGFIIAAVFYRRLFIVFAVGIALFYILFYPLNNWLKAQYNFNLQSVGIIARLTTNNPEADSIKWRADVANKVIPLIEHRPLLGYGNGSFSKVWEYEKGVANIWDNTSEAHNDYLKVTFETGLVGIILFLSIFASLIYRQLKIAQKKSWTNIVFIASIAVYLVMSLSDNMLHHTPVIWWWWSIWGLWAGERL